MKPITQKVLDSGLIDKGVAQMMEAWGFLPNGTAEKMDEEALRAKTTEEMKKAVEEVADILEREHVLRETYLDLNRLRWPVTVFVRNDKGQSTRDIDGLVDRMGRYYFRIQDVNPEWFVPGYELVRKASPIEEGFGVKGVPMFLVDNILEKQILYIEDMPICVQVSVE